MNHIVVLLQDNIRLNLNGWMTSQQYHVETNGAALYKTKESPILSVCNPNQNFAVHTRSIFQEK